jgi:hypothetical protein
MQNLLKKRERDYILRQHVVEIQRELAVYRAPSWIKPGAKIISHELGQAVNEPVEVLGEPFWRPGWGWHVKTTTQILTEKFGPHTSRCDLLAEREEVK